MLDEYLAVETLVHGEPLYRDLLDRVRQDRNLVAAMWEDALSRPDELDVPDTHWTVALLEDGTPAAWCAAHIQEGPDGPQVKCHSNYVLRAHRERGLYEAAYHARHHTVLLAYKVPAETYLFPEPIDLHLADRWFKDTTPAASGVSSPHPDGPRYRWQRLTWTPRESR